jgi:prefoldin subunit 5
LRSAQPAVSHRGKPSVIVQWAVPLAANDRLDELYAVQRLVQAEVDRLQQEHDSLHEPPGRLRRYILNVQIEALQEEATRLSARISDVLERDLQR